MLRKIIYIAALLSVTLFGCSEEIDPVGTVEKADEIDKPFDLEASIGDGKVVLSWSVSDSSAVLYYNLYYAGASSIEDMNLIDTSVATVYTFEGLSNDRVYYFRVASVGVAGLEGEMSESVGTIPSIFSITIDNFSRFTNDRKVIISSIAPEGASLVDLSEDSSFITGVNTVPFNESIGFELSDNDGVKTVYARFSLTGGGSAADIVSDSIILDREAEIKGLTVHCPGDTVLTSDTTLSAGDEIEFRIYVDSSDSGGEAAVDIPGLITLDLIDFITDTTAGAFTGVYYSGNYVIPVNTELTNTEITGGFTDAAGNDAPELKADILLSVTSLPQAVEISGFALSSSEIDIIWTRSNITDFSAYRLFRSYTADVSDLSELINTATSQSVLRYGDTGLDENIQYFYRLYVYDNEGNSAGSDILAMTTLAAEMPDSVVLSGFATSSSAIELDWTKSTISNFANYRLFRSYSDQVSDTSLAVTTVGSQVVLNYVDADNLNADSTYYYRLYVYDDNGYSTGSNSIAVKTPINEPPEAVQLAVNVVDSTAELSWTESPDSDFKAYHILRDIDAPTPYDPTKVIKFINSKTQTSYSDSPTAGSHNYQVWVVDEQDMKAGSDSVSVTIP